MSPKPKSYPSFHIEPGSLVNILGVVYVHQKTIDGGDIYLTRFGLPFQKLLSVENWYEKDWYEKRRIRLEGTSSVYRITTKEIDGQSIDIVVKNCRVGEDVPVQTRTLLEFINAEFNSPWEEFSLVMEMREGKFGDAQVHINTQKPLAIYVPPEKMQTWQSGRSIDKINRVMARHPGIHIDILKQYKLIYGWIYGKDIAELFSSLQFKEEISVSFLAESTTKVINDLQLKGFAIADMKPCHIIIGEEEIKELQLQYGAGFSRMPNPGPLMELVIKGKYSVVDYELLTRTAEHENEISTSRRLSYHDCQLHRFIATPVPSHLHLQNIFDLCYIHGQVESTGGKLWVVGKNATLFDYFLPERWRKTQAWKLSFHNDIYYTVTKDHIHIVWKISRVGEKPQNYLNDPLFQDIFSYGYNSPFEEFSIAQKLNEAGIPTVYIRAIYMTGSPKLESSDDFSRYQSHRHLKNPDGSSVLCEQHNYITIRGFYNGPDEWMARQQCLFCRPLDLQHALHRGYIENSTAPYLKSRIQNQLLKAGYDGTFLKFNDFLLSVDSQGKLILDKDGYPDMRICNFELIRKL